MIELIQRPMGRRATLRLKRINYQMPQVNSDLVYELIMEWSIGATVSNNIFGYWNDDPTPADPASPDLIDAFTTVVVTPMLALINARVSLVKVSARRLNNITDFAVTTFNSPGGIAADSQANFVAFKVAKNRLTKETRSGWTNIMGVSEVDTVVGGQSLESAALTRLETVATALQATLVPTVNSFRPVIIGNRYNSAVTPPDLRPESDWVYNLISSMSADPFVTSQVSRKR